MKSIFSLSPHNYYELEQIICNGQLASYRLRLAWRAFENENEGPFSDKLNAAFRFMCESVDFSAQIQQDYDLFFKAVSEGFEMNPEDDSLSLLKEAETAS